MTLAEGDNPGLNLAQLTKAFFVIALVQGAFWLLFYPVFIAPSPSGEIAPYTVTGAQYAALDAPTPAAVAEAEFDDLSLDELLYAPRGYGFLRVQFELPEVPDEGLGLLENGPGDNIAVYANSVLIHGEGEMLLPDVSYDHLTRERIRIPAAALQVGSNQIDIVHTQETGVEYVPGLPLIADYKSVERAFAWKQTLMNEARIVSATAGFVIALFAFVALLRAKSRRMLFWLFAISLLWPLRNLFQLWPDIPLHGFERSLYYGLTTLGVAACWPLLLDAWTGNSNRIFRRSVFATALIAGIAVTYWSTRHLEMGAFTQIENILDYTGLALMAAMLVRLVWHVVAEREGRFWELALLTLLASLMALFLINTLLWDRHVGYLNLGQPLFLVAFAIAYFARNFRLFQSSAQINEALAAQLDEKTSALLAAHEREKQLVRKEAHLLERQRIMRDMHDGLGSNLMSMMLAARRGVAEPGKVAEGLQSVIDEMRLMIDSMDSVGDSLASALATFRQRTQSRVEGAGFTLEWREERKGDLPTIGQRRVLQIFRIMQEAVTNALKHSAGDTVIIEVAQVHNESRDLKIAIRDNGSGMHGTRVVGHGLDNMSARAKAADVTLTIQNSEEGVTVELVIEAEEVNVS